MFLYEYHKNSFENIRTDVKIGGFPISIGRDSGFGIFQKKIGRILTKSGWVDQGSQIRQNCSDDSPEFKEGVTSTPEIFGNKQGATSTPEIFGNKHSFVLTFFATNTIYINCKRCKP